MFVAKKKMRRFGNPAKQAEVNASCTARLLAVQTAAVAAEKENAPAYSCCDCGSKC